MMEFTAEVYVTLKPSILDPQGSAVGSTLSDLGYTEIHEVRVGKYLTLNFEAQDQERAQQQLNELCQRILSNPVIEDYRFKVVEVGR